MGDDLFCPPSTDPCSQTPPTMKHFAVDLHNDRHEFGKSPDPKTQIALASPGNQPAPRKAALHDEIGGERKLMLQKFDTIVETSDVPRGRVRNWVRAHTVLGTYTNYDNG